MNKYYVICSDVVNKKYISAPKISSSSTKYKTCIKCGSVRHEIIENPMKIIIEGKGNYPDILECGEYPYLIISKKTLDLFDASSVSGFKADPIKLLNYKGEAIDSNSIQYYNIDISNELEMDFKKMGIKVIDICPLCSRVKFSKKTWEFGDIILKHDVNNLPDLFTLKYFKRKIFCSKRVLEIIHRNKLTNFIFKNGQKSFDYFSAELDITKEID